MRYWIISCEEFARGCTTACELRHGIKTSYLKETTAWMVRDPAKCGSITIVITKTVSNFVNKRVNPQGVWEY